MLNEFLMVTGAFVLCVVVFGLVEFYWPAHKGRPSTRTFWQTDVLHFFVSNTISKFMVIFVISRIASLITYPTEIEALRAQIGSQPLWLQFIEVIVISDVVQYWMHRWAHEIPFLWKFHAVHHSSETMDWLANARAHPIDQALRRIATLLVLLLLGLSESTFYLYWFVFAPLHSFFIHSNFRFRLPGLRYVITTPEFHHWHHVTDPVDKNYAGRLPVLDWLFGTYHMPDDKRATNFGCADPVPPGYIAQMIYPLRKAGASGGPASHIAEAAGSTSSQSGVRVDDP